MGIIKSSRDQSLHVSGPKDLKGKGKQQKNPKTKFDAPKTRFENQQHDHVLDYCDKLIWYYSSQRDEAQISQKQGF